MLTNSLGDRLLITLDTEETFIYNLFYSALASSVGYMFAVVFVLNNSIFLKPKKTRLRIRSAINDQRFFTWSFLLWFGKLAGLLGIVYLSSSLQFEIDFLKEFPLLLILLPLVVFFAAWPGLSRVIRRRKFMWLVLSFGLYSLMSVGFAFRNFIDYEKMNETLLENSIYYAYDLKVPATRCQQTLERRGMTTDIYMVKDAADKSKPLIFFNDINAQVEPDSIKQLLHSEIISFPASRRNNMVVNLHIDEDIPMSYVNELKHQLSKGGQEKVQYSTGRKYSKYPSNHPAIKYSGLPQALPLLSYPELETFLDSAENIDFTRYAIRLPYRIQTIQNLNRIEVRVEESGTMLNGRVVQKDELKKIVYQFVKKYSPNYVILLNADDHVTYGKYIQHLDLIHMQIDKLRNEASFEIYNQPFDIWSRSDGQSNIISMYPTNVAEWTVEAKKLLQLKRKADNIQLSVKSQRH